LHLHEPIQQTKMILQQQGITLFWRRRSD